MLVFQPASILDPALALREIEAEFAKCWSAIGGGTGGGGGTPGGANTNVQFNSSAAFGGDSGFTYAGGGQATLAFGTVTANAKALNITGTWNSSGVTFDAPLFMNITNTASAAGSALMDLQVGGASQCRINSNGDIVLTNATPNGYWGGIRGGFGTFFVYGQPAINFFVNGLTTFAIDAGFGAIVVPNPYSISFGNPGSDGGDTKLWRDGVAGALAQRNLTNAQSLRVYNTYTDASNYERGGFDWQTTANVFRVRSTAAGTGTQRLLAIDGFSKAGAPTTADIPAGTWALVRDTSGSTTKLYYNNAGTLQSVALA